MNDKELRDLILQERICSADWLVLHARNLAHGARLRNSATLLVFSCLEARNAIEQLWFELLIVIHGGSMTKDLFKKCQRRRDGFLAAIAEAEPRYRQLSQFTGICMKLDGRAPFAIIAWDLGRLKKLWQRLSSYCHAQAHPALTLEDPHWFVGGLNLVEEVFNYFQKEMSGGATGIMSPDAMKPQTRMIWDDFASDRINHEQVQIRLKLAQPLLNGGRGLR